MNHQGYKVYLGSMIDTSYWSKRRAPLDIPPEYEYLYSAMQEVYSESGAITSERLIRKLILTQGTGSDLARDLVNEFKLLSVESLSEFYACEVALLQVLKESSIEELPNLINKWKRQGKTADEISRLTREYLDKIDGKFIAGASSADWDRQAAEFDRIQELMRSRIGQPLKCFPPAWGLNRYVRSIEKGRLVVMSGGTGDGKSSLAMSYAEWQAQTGRNVIVVHMEDSLQTILMRQTVRNIPSTTLEELEGGDPEDKLLRMKKIRESWPGRIYYEYMAGLNIDQIILRLEEICLKDSIDDIVIDYFQKIDFISDASASVNMIAQAGLAVEKLKLLAEKWNNNVFLVSQTTPDTDGKLHTQWTRELEKKPQYYLEVQRKIVEKPEDSVLVTIGQATVPIADVGDRTPWIRLMLKKVNDGRTGSSWIVFNGPRFLGMTPEYWKKLNANPEFANEIPVYTQWNDRKKQQQKSVLAAHEAVFTQENPDEKKRRKTLAKGDL
jgi:hypothetical protein